jgi:hypothetical protein
MKILISGSSGLIGSALVARLQRDGHTITRLVRSTKRPYAEATVLWQPVEGKLSRAALEGFDGVVHLAGENISGGRWTQAEKDRIRRSRVTGTKLLAESLAGLERPPKVLVSASAMGYYGDHGDELVTEETGPGVDFLADVCREWEAACQPAVDKGIRVVYPRTGIVLAREGGALAKMLLPFRLCLGGRMGDGFQYMSWITLDDEVSALVHLLESDSVSGPVNLAAPNPVTNREFTKTLARVLGRPAILPIPAFMLRLVLGEMADALLLTSTRMSCEKLEGSGFSYEDAELEGALRRVLVGRDAG